MQYLSVKNCMLLNTFLVVSCTHSDHSPYNSAINGSAGKGIGGYLVPAPGDADHQFVAPADTDIRGPCPGLNAAANRKIQRLKSANKKLLIFP
jgi:hypothetical protein